jgi:hypothetical protein
MLTTTSARQRLAQVFNEKQAAVLADVIHESYSDLVRTGDFNELKEIVRNLAAAQQELTAAQQELASAQGRTERALQKLSRQVGGLSDRMGGDLEDLAYIVIHDVLTRELGWRVEVLARSWPEWNGREEEIDLLGRAHDPDRPDATIWIIGEVKFNLTLKDVRRFVKKVAEAKSHLDGELFPVCFCYRARPEVRRAVQEAGFRLVFSYGHMI